MRYTGKLTFSIPMKEVRLYVDQGNLDNRELREAVSDALFHTVEGYINGQGTYRFDDWQFPFFRDLVEFNDQLSFTEKGKERFPELTIK